MKATYSGQTIFWWINKIFLQDFLIWNLGSLISFEKLKVPATWIQFLILEKCQSSWNPCHNLHDSLKQKWAIKSSTKPPKCWLWHQRHTPGFFLHVIWLSLKAIELEAPEICSRCVWLLNLRLQRFAVDGFLWSIGGGGYGSQIKLLLKCIYCAI